MAPVLSVSVDLDELSSYLEIHGLVAGAEPASRAVWTVAVPRFLELFGRLGVKATFFVVGTSLDPAIGAPLAREIAAAGHELANHTHSHYYDLLRRGPEQRRDEIARAADALETVAGVRPRGFRAPGYNLDDDLLALLIELGYQYDSSVFPSPPYYLAKAAALLAIRARGRRSRSLLGPSQVLLAPTEPYWVEDRFWRRRRLASAPRAGTGLVELPVAVVPGIRVHFIGTTITLAGPRGATAMALAVSRRKFVGLELHGIDLLDADDEGPAPLVGHQPDVKVPLPRKTAALEAAIRTLQGRGARVMTCLEAAQEFVRSRAR
jgi:peptidoglycan-N-acetylglucosamine deacetylase